VPVVAFGFVANELVTSRFASDDVVPDRFASDQPEERASRWFIACFKRDDRAAPQSATRCHLATGNMKSCFLLQRMSQEIDVLGYGPCSERNGDVMVKYRNYIDGPTLLISCSCWDERKGVAIAVDAICKGQLRVRGLHQSRQRLSNVLKGTIWTLG
jgi:hypothetical protein